MLAVNHCRSSRQLLRFFGCRSPSVSFFHHLQLPCLLPWVQLACLAAVQLNDSSSIKPRAVAILWIPVTAILPHHTKCHTNHFLASAAMMVHLSPYAGSGEPRAHVFLPRNPHSSLELGRNSLLFDTTLRYSIIYPGSSVGTILSFDSVPREGCMIVDHCFSVTCLSLYRELVRGIPVSLSPGHRRWGIEA